MGTVTRHSRWQAVEGPCGWAEGWKPCRHRQWATGVAPRHAVMQIWPQPPLFTAQGWDTGKNYNVTTSKRFYIVFPNFIYQNATFSKILICHKETVFSSELILNLQKKCVRQFTVDSLTEKYQKIYFPIGEDEKICVCSFKQHHFFFGGMLNTLVPLVIFKQRPRC